MTNIQLRYPDVLGARRAYSEGRNVTEFLRKQLGVIENTPAIIEAAYDLQAGSYIEQTEKNRPYAMRYAAELAGLLDQQLAPGDSLLDIGTGEITTLSLVAQHLAVRPSQLYAFDISHSRIFQGLKFARDNLPLWAKLTAFVGDIGEIPLLDKSVGVTTSSHALEPNGGNLEPLMRELFRVTRRRLVLFEPCYEINSQEGQQRMDRLGYIKDLPGVVQRLGGRLIGQHPVVNVGNPLNPTVCFVIEPPADQHGGPASSSTPFAVPGTNLPLVRSEDFYLSEETGLCFPVLRSVPVLKSSAAILATTVATAKD